MRLQALSEDDELAAAIAASLEQSGQEPSPSGLPAASTSQNGLSSHPNHLPAAALGSQPPAVPSHASAAPEFPPANPTPPSSSLTVIILSVTMSLLRTVLILIMCRLWSCMKLLAWPNPISWALHQDWFKLSCLTCNVKTGELKQHPALRDPILAFHLDLHSSSMKTAHL